MSLILSKLSSTALLGATGAVASSSTTPLLFMSSATLGLGLGARARPVLSTFGRSALIGGLALTGNRSFTTGTDGVGHDVGKLVSTATEKIGLGDNQVRCFKVGRPLSTCMRRPLI